MTTTDHKTTGTVKLSTIEGSAAKARRGIAPPQAGMDKKIERKYPKWLRSAVLGGGGAVALAALLYFFAPEGGRTLRVEGDRVVVSTVSTGQFDDFIPVRGRVTPLKTIFLDAVEGGQVEAIHIEDGNIVEAGQLIVELSNTQLQLSVIGQEAAVTEQLNFLRNIELQLEQNQLRHRTTINDIEYAIVRLGREIVRQGQLVADGLMVRRDFEQLKDEHDYNIKRLALEQESQETDARLQKAQMEQLRSATIQLELSLTVARDNLDGLNVRAPVRGQLTAFDLEIGQSLAPGLRIGQIDDPDNFKITANIDEFYLSRVDLGQTAQFQLSGRDFQLRISKVYPQVTNGQFEVDMVFSGQSATDIRRGQTVQTRLQLGDPSDALLIPNGAFYQDTGGNWIFVVASDGSQAVRRNVRLGRRNLRFIEVLDGLEVGEKVITSPYTNYLEMDRLEIGT